MSLALVASIAGPILGGLFGGSSAKSAAATQAKAAERAAELNYQATQDANALIRESRDLNRADQAPWRNSGQGSLNKLSYLMGIPGYENRPTNRNYQYTPAGGAGGVNPATNSYGAPPPQANQTTAQATPPPTKQLQDFVPYSGDFLPPGWRLRGSNYGDPGGSYGIGPEYIDAQGNRKNQHDLRQAIKEQKDAYDKSKQPQAQPTQQATQPIDPSANQYGSTDTVPAMLTPGEAVLNTGAVQAVGPNYIQELNKFGKSGQPVQAFADGGIVQPNRLSMMMDRPVRGYADGGVVHPPTYVRPGYNRTMFPETEAENAIYRGGQHVATQTPNTPVNSGSSTTYTTRDRARERQLLGGATGKGSDAVFDRAWAAGPEAYAAAMAGPNAGTPQPGSPTYVRPGYNRNMFPTTEAENAIYRGGIAAQPSTDTPLTPKIQSPGYVAPLPNERGGAQPISRLLGGSSQSVLDTIKRAQTPPGYGSGQPGTGSGYPNQAFPQDSFGSLDEYTPINFTDRPGDYANPNFGDTYGGYANPNFNNLTRDYTMADFEADPGYAFRRDEGAGRVESSAAARGSQLSGATLKALTRFGQDYGSNEFSNAFNRYRTQRIDQYGQMGDLYQRNEAQRADRYGQRNDTFNRNEARRLDRYGQRSDTYNRIEGQKNNRFNRLSALAGGGQFSPDTSGTQIGSNLINSANTRGGYITDAATARGTGSINNTNSIVSGIGTAFNNWQQRPNQPNQWLNPDTGRYQ